MSALRLDQATELRRLVRTAAAPRLARSGARVLAVASGKGGVGKTNVAVNLSILLARRGKRVLLVDADLGTANADLLLDLNAAHNLAHVLAGDHSIDDVAVDAPIRRDWPGSCPAGALRVLAGASGLADVADLHETDRRRLLTMLADAESACDWLVVDCGAGVSANVTAFAAACDELLVVATPEPTSITDAYALIKVVVGLEGRPSIRLLVNQARDAADGRRVAERIALVSARFMGVIVQPVGVVPYDEHLVRAVRFRRPVVESYPTCPASAAFSALAERFVGREAAAPGSRGFFRRALEFFN